MKKTILIFGISSFVGSNLAELLGDEYRIIGTYNKTPVKIPGVVCVPCDVLKKDYVSRVVSVFDPDFSIYAAGLSSLTESHRNAKKCEALNSVGAINCSVASERVGCKFIYLSSGYVFSGDDIAYKESDTPFPTTTYGSSLSSTEFYVQRSSLNYWILRCAPLYGRSFNPLLPNWFELMQSGLAKGQNFSADDFVKTGFLDIYYLAKFIKSLIKTSAPTRLIHVSSSDVMTRFQFAKTYAKIFRKDENLILPSSGHFPAGAIASKSSNAPNSAQHFFKLDVGVLESLIGETVPTIEESLMMTYQRLSSRI
jgi:dTDP-4-dehydrorhamnose reductase